MTKFSLSSAAKKAGMTRSTLERWILLKKVKFRRKPIGDMTYYEIDGKEVERLKILHSKKKKAAR